MFKIFTLITALSLSAQITAGTFPGTLDQTFNSNETYGTPRGTVTTSFGSYDAAGSSVALQADGKIVVAGTYNAQFAIARYNTDGSPDTSFNSTGRNTTAIGTDSGAYGVTIQTDGKIIAVGFSDGKFALARYNTDGSLDTATFNPTAAGGTQAGTVITAIGTNDAAFSVKTDTVSGVGIEKIVVAGYAEVNDNFCFAVARYNNNGSLDTEYFNPTAAGGTQAGTVATPFTEGDAFGLSMVIQNGFKIVVSGYVIDGASDKFALVRYNPDGTVDTSFGSNNNGKVITPILNSAQACGVTLQTTSYYDPSAKIIVAGFANDGSRDTFALARYTANGVLDTTFGATGTGIVTTEIEQTNKGFAVTVQVDKAIIVAGKANSGGANKFALARYTENGTLDTTFNPQGTKPGTTTTSINDAAVATAVALQSNGAIVAAGTTDQTASNPEAFAVARYNNIGQPTGLNAQFNYYRNTNSFQIPLTSDSVPYASRYIVTLQINSAATLSFSFLKIKNLILLVAAEYFPLGTSSSTLTITAFNAAGVQGQSSTQTFDVTR